jgi:hypothetical protein
VSLVRVDFWLVTGALALVFLAAWLGLEDPRRAPVVLASVKPVAVPPLPPRIEPPPDTNPGDDVDRLFDTPDRRRPGG